ncbi:MAG: hypothetical protein ACJAVK_002824, partial [Akkermansiaceae bacterium]
TIENLQRTIDFNREVNVPWSIDDVHAITVPETSRGSGLNGNSPLSFLDHEIGRGLAIVDLTRFVNFTGELEDPLGGRGLSGINVCEDANVTVFTEVYHDILSRETRVIITSPPFCRVWSETF